MKNKFATIKNLILLIASALTLVAVTFAWYSVSNTGSFSKIVSSIKGSTISVNYYESADGKSFTETNEDLNMTNMYAGSNRYYKMDVTTYKDTPIKLVMSFDNLSASNALANYVYFDYKVVRNDTEQTLAQNSNLRMADYASKNVFSENIYSLQTQGCNNFTVYYTVHVVGGSGTLPTGTVSLGEVKLLGQQV